MPASDAGLYGISDANSSRYGDDLWGKNQFNSTFPLSLCLLMRDKQLDPVCITAQSGKIGATEKCWAMTDVIGPKGANPFYHFEKAFDPYTPMVRKITDHIDLVVEIDGVHRIPLEIKLTVVPDQGTSKRTESQWSPEVVMRPVTSAYAMMGVATSLASDKARAKQILRSAYNYVADWNESAVTQNAEQLHLALDKALQLAEPLQKPFLVQPIWRTKGQSLDLCDQCFDVFVWSDVAVMRIPVEQYSNERSKESKRFLREIARHVRALYEVLSQGDYNYQGIYKGMAFGVQTDKSFALSGTKSYRYLKHPRLRNPALSRDILNKIILNGGENNLKPERRFDSAVLAYHIARGEAC